MAWWMILVWLNDRTSLYMCACVLKGFLVVILDIKIFGPYAWRKKIKWSSWGVKQKSCRQRVFHSPPKD